MLSSILATTKSTIARAGEEATAEVNCIKEDPGEENAAGAVDHAVRVPAVRSGSSQLQQVLSLPSLTARCRRSRGREVAVEAHHLEVSGEQTLPALSIRDALEVRSFRLPAPEVSSCSSHCKMSLPAPRRSSMKSTVPRSSRADADAVNRAMP